MLKHSLTYNQYDVVPGVLPIHPTPRVLFVTSLVLRVVRFHTLQGKGAPILPKCLPSQLPPHPLAL